jgi:hypothetical protein
VILPDINIGRPAAGCVTWPVSELLEVLRWRSPAASPQITMGAGTARTGTGH